MKFIMKKYLQNFSHLKYFTDYFFQMKYSDDFGWNVVWNKEIDRWLKNIYLIDQRYYAQQKNRVVAKKQRDELLGEYKAIYFLSKIKGLRIESIEPTSIGSRKNDFSFIDKSGIKWHAEVKSPSWQVEVFKDDKLTLKEKIDRKSKPQFINGEGRSVSVVDAIDDAIKKSTKQFNPNNNNLLIVCPNMFSPVTFFAPLDHGHRIEESLKKYDTRKVISSVIIIEPVLDYKNVVKYQKFVFPVIKRIDL